MRYLAQPAVGRGLDVPDLLRAHGFGGRAVVIVGAGFDLADEEHLAVGGEDVDLAFAAAPVAAQDGEARGFDEGGGQVFASPA